MKTKRKQKKLILVKKKLWLLAIGAGVLLFVAGCGAVSPVPKPVTLEYWGVWNEASDIEPIIQAYEQKYSHVKINYKKFRFDEYQDELITAWAQDRGPDIFSIPNSWVRAYGEFITPMPEATTMTRQYTKESLAGTKKEIITEDITTRGYNEKTLDQTFLDVVKDDVYMNGQIQALPLSLDTLALYYNKDLLAQAGAAQPPTIWSDFVEFIPKLTLQDRDGNIVQSGAALGTANNIDRSADILLALMLQNGTDIMEKGIHIAGESTTQPGYFPGSRALEFYTDFARPTKQVYTWNQDMPQSLEAFTQGNTTFFFGYAYHLPLIESQAQDINFDVTKLPQISTDFSINFANYWVETVAKKSQNPNAAWDFINFATNEANVIPFLEKSNKPTALRSLLAQQASTNFSLSPFITQGLTAKSWYRGIKPVEAEDIINSAITRIIVGDTPNEDSGDPYTDVLQETGQKLQATLQ